MAKSRVAPVKRVSLPRLELLAAYITAKLLDYVIQALRIVVDAVYGWSDSQITLAWIRRPTAHWKAFVANRVQDIHQRVAPSQWRFCPGSQNPADLVTRGVCCLLFVFVSVRLKQLCSSYIWARTHSSPIHISFTLWYKYFDKLIV